MVAMAGLEAEKVLHRRTPNPITNGDTNDREFVAELAASLSLTAADLEGLRERTKALLAANADTVARIADALLERETLTGGQVFDVIGPDGWADIVSKKLSIHLDK